MTTSRLFDQGRHWAVILQQAQSRVTTAFAKVFASDEPSFISNPLYSMPSSDSEIGKDLYPSCRTSVDIMSLVIAAFVTALSILYAYHTHMTSTQEKDRRRKRDAEYFSLARQYEVLRLHLIFSERQNEEIEHRVAEYEATASKSRSLLAEHTQEVRRLQSELESAERVRNLKDMTVEQARKALAAQSREISQLRGNLARAESDCREKAQQIRTMEKEHGTAKVVCARYENQVLELCDKLSECLTLLSQSARSSDWMKATALQSSLPPAYQEYSHRQRAPTRKPSRPSTDPNKSAFDYHILDESPNFH